MGIPLFQKYIKDVYSTACKKTWQNVSYDNLYIDLNCVLHHVCYLAKDSNDLLIRFRDYLRKIILATKPKKRVYLAADGPAPMAKMMLQRKRRLDSVKTLDTDIDLKKNLDLNLTPGTDFMMKLEKELSGFVTYIKNRYKVDVITSITDADEGEIKIRGQLGRFQKKYPDETHLVYSTDSDMILLLFTCDDLSKIYQILGKDVIIHLGTILDKHREKFGKTDSDKYDFVFINLMMGNDYIPKVSYLKLENVWEAYKTVSKNRPSGLISYQESVMTVNQIFIHDLMYIASKKVPDHLLKKFHPTDLSNSFYINYVQGLHWCFEMYTSGRCANYRYIYDHTESPHIWGAMWTIMFNNTHTVTKTKSIDVDLYGILLIPEKANSLLTKEQNLIAAKLVTKHPIIYEIGRCVKCKNFCETIVELRDKVKMYEENEQWCGKDDITKRIKKLEKTFKTHRETHKKLSAETIDNISKSFVQIRDKLRETISLDDSDNESTYSKPYQPQQKAIIKKRLF